MTKLTNLENLKKQAKQFLRWHRARHHPVAAEIRATLPRYRDLSDTEVLDAPFQLSYAQELIARRAGFESWRALKDGTAAMTRSSKDPATKPALIAAEPMLFVSDLVASRDFFAGTLGFTA